jgi:hypothetical protein
MSIPPPEPPGNHGTALGLVDRILKYLDRPWKAFVIVMLAVVGFVGWFVYTHSDELFEAWMTPSEVRLRTENVTEALTKLIEETKADLVQIWSVDLPTNSQHFIAARRHDGERPVVLSPRRLPIIVSVSDVIALERVLEGSPVCTDLHDHGTPLVKRLHERGMKRACAIPIPPSAQAFVGVIYLVWTTPADAAAEKVAVGAAREISAKMLSN